MSCLLSSLLVTPKSQPGSLPGVMRIIDGSSDADARRFSVAQSQQQYEKRIERIQPSRDQERALGYLECVLVAAKC